MKPLLALQNNLYCSCFLQF